MTTEPGLVVTDRLAEAMALVAEAVGRDTLVDEVVDDRALVFLLEVPHLQVATQRDGDALGMNFKFMPELDWQFGYPFSIALMLVFTGFVLLIFRWKKWL